MLGGGRVDVGSGQEFSKPSKTATQLVCAALRIAQYRVTSELVLLLCPDSIFHFLQTIRSSISSYLTFIIDTFPTLQSEIVFWRDLTLHADPVKIPIPSSPRILAIGGGVTGLVSAWVTMTFLMNLETAKGAAMITRQISGELFDQQAELLKEFDADVIINATGLSGREVAGDGSCYLIRGGLVRAINNGKHYPRVEAALTIPVSAADEIVFLFPRNDDILLIGAFTEPKKDTLDLTLDSPVVQRMWSRCDDFLPELRNAKLDPVYPFAQSLRPFRERNVRVERELRPRRITIYGPALVHSCGQRGSGWSLAFGCASDVAKLVEEDLVGLPPQPMQTEIAGDLSVHELVRARF
ncbi:hypothetical protein BCR34DRAFT_497071 [Clohesyomyces aquaticus]|uniref:FAD dependent oxidoreductase domain-containing protein n=1 Tax=Clohesyomyces aquaticus TaxID=1231657 RepID=A0A1Y1YHQ9_9PLEO|nr:hypothetical protein BCR34DRAFT_497071 [Clohesyomyces aquaticus]